MDEKSHEKISPVMRFLPLTYLVFAVLVIGGLWLAGVSQSIILIAIFLLFMGMHVFGHGGHRGHGGHGGGCCGPMGGGKRDNEPQKGEGDKKDEGSHRH
jgi:hypothetical protein